MNVAIFKAQAKRRHIDICIELIAHGHIVSDDREHNC